MTSSSRVIKLEHALQWCHQQRILHQTSYKGKCPSISLVQLLEQTWSDVPIAVGGFSENACTKVDEVDHRNITFAGVIQYCRFRNFAINFGIYHD